jgi:hypothetical protein
VLCCAALLAAGGAAPVAPLPSAIPGSGVNALPMQLAAGAG